VCSGTSLDGARPYVGYVRSPPHFVRALAAALVTVTLAGCASTKGRPGPFVRDIEIRGNKKLSDGELKKRILTTESGRWPWSQPRRFDAIAWESDLLRIERAYAAQGFYEARVQSSQVIQKPDDRVDLIISVDEGGPVQVGSVDVRGLEPLPPEERERLLDVADIDIVPGEVFLESEWASAKESLLRVLRNSGFAQAEVHGEALVDVGTKKAKLTLFAQPGQVFRFGDVDVRGPGIAHIPAWRVHEQVRLAIRPDERFSDDALEEAQRRVFGMGVFATARVTTGAPDPKTGVVPVTVEVREAPYHTLRAGGGIGIDQVRQEARGLLAYTDRNFLGGLRRLDTELVAGWAFIPNTYAVFRNQTDDAALRNGPIYRASAELEQPRFLGNPSLRLRALAESERTLEETYDAIGGRSRLGVVWQPWTSFTLFPAYHLQAYWLNGSSAAGFETAPLALGCDQDPCFVLLSYLEEVVSWDKRDDILEPRNGHYLSLSLQQGGGPLGGSFDYLRVLPEARAYQSFGDDDQFTLSAKLRVGTLVTSTGAPEDSPVVARFYSGGPSWMRGFGMRRLSPLLLAPAPDARNGKPEVTYPIGGNGIIEASVEARQQVAESILVAGFLDFGNVTPDRLPRPQLKDLQWAVGFGARYLSPIGPIRLDFGVRLPWGRPPPLFDANGNEITYQRGMNDEKFAGRETGDFVNKSCFGFGGNSARTWVPDGLCSLHISIGEAF
jgi:translocation and assembly module TamA